MPRGASHERTSSKSVRAYEAWMRQAARPGAGQEGPCAQAREDGRRARSSSCAAPIGAGPKPSSRSARTWCMRPPSSRSATSIWRISAPGAMTTAAWCGASTTSTRPPRCPTRSISSGWRRARCWPIRTGSIERGRDMRCDPRGLSPGLVRADADRARPRLGLAARAVCGLRRGSAPSSGARSRRPIASPRPRATARRSPPPCRSRAADVGLRAGPPAPAAWVGRAGSASPNGTAPRSCARSKVVFAVRRDARARGAEQAIRNDARQRKYRANDPGIG